MANKDQSTLFDREELSTKTVPLAEKLRPQTLEELLGQTKLIAENSPLRQMIESGEYHSFILWGPPGSGKTTIVSLLSGKHHESFDPLKPSIITVKIPDKRLKAIAKIVNPQKTTESEITFIDIKGYIIDGLNDLPFKQLIPLYREILLQIPQFQQFPFFRHALATPCFSNSALSRSQQAL